MNTKSYENGFWVLETQMKQRAYDGKWERLGKIVDYAGEYAYATESGSKVTLIPEKWVTLGVYDLLLEFVD